MKITLYQILLAFVFSTITLANSAKGQKKLDTKISVSLNNMNLNRVIKKLEKSANVKFSYNSK